MIFVDDAPEGIFDEGCFNCLGYAMGVKEWLDIDNCYNERGLMSLTLCLAELEDMFPRIIRIGPKRAVTQDYDTTRFYAIAFRVGNARNWSDFHVMRQQDNGLWYQKCGALSGIWMHEGDIRQPWRRDDGKVYRGRIAFYLVPRG